MYINRQTLEVTVDLVIPNTSLPKTISDVTLASLGFARLVRAPRPKHAPERVILDGVVTELNGVYTQGWVVDDSNVDLTRNLRINRDNKLTYTDYTQATDTTQTVTDKAAWVTYRQELRDLPATYASNPEDVVWPLPPGNQATTAEII